MFPQYVDDTLLFLRLSTSWSAANCDPSFVFYFFQMGKKSSDTQLRTWTFMTKQHVSEVQVKLLDASEPPWRKVCTTCRVKWFLLLITYQPDNPIYWIVVDVLCCINTHHWDSCSSLLQSIDYWPSIRLRYLVHFEWSHMGHCNHFIISVTQLSDKFSFFIHADLYLHCGWILTCVMLSMNQVQYKVR